MGVFRLKTAHITARFSPHEHIADSECALVSAGERLTDEQCLGELAKAQVQTIIYPQACDEVSMC